MKELMFAQSWYVSTLAQSGGGGESWRFSIWGGVGVAPTAAVMIAARITETFMMEFDRMGMIAKYV